MTRKTSKLQPVVKRAEKVRWRSGFFSVLGVASPRPPVFRCFGAFCRGTEHMDIYTSRSAATVCESDRLLAARERCTTGMKVVEHSPEGAKFDIQYSIPRLGRSLALPNGPASKPSS